MQRIPRAHNKKINQLKKQQCRYTMPNKHTKRHHWSLGKCKWTPQRQQDMPVAKARTEAERQRRQQGRSQRRRGRGGWWAHAAGAEGVLGLHACAPGWRGLRHGGGPRKAGWGHQEGRGNRAVPGFPTSWRSQRSAGTVCAQQGHTCSRRVPACVCVCVCVCV